MIGATIAQVTAQQLAVWVPRIALGVGAAVLTSAVVQNTAEAITDKVEGGDTTKLLRRLLLDNALMPVTLTRAAVVDALQVVGLSYERVMAIAQGKVAPTRSDLSAMEAMLARVLAQAAAGQAQQPASNGAQP